MTQRHPRKRKRRLKPWVPYALAGIVAVIVGIIVFAIIHTASEKRGADNGSAVQSETTEETTTEGEPTIISSITVGSTGDILIHPSVLWAFETEDGHDFTPAFEYVAPYYKALDLMVVNLEVPLVDPDDGYEYSSNPFASPDAVAEALKWAGADICLTANNHTYDMGGYGLIRTQNVLDRVGLEYTGTRKESDDSFILIKDVNDIRLGMICYTYETGGGSYYSKSLNYNPLDDDDAPLVNTFDYDDLDTFYEDAERQIREMSSQNCDVKIFYMHWGEEYQDQPNDIQTEIARKLCELGVDVIIGGHPHVIQRFDRLESTDGHKTLCLYSMGNELSNQRREFMNEDDYRGYTEDGLIFILKIDKYSNGEIDISNVSAIPTWVQRDDSFEIIPLDPKLDPQDWPADDIDLAKESFERTMERVWDLFEKN